MMDLLRAMAAEGRTILFSSHILEEVERLADSILVVHAGRLAAAGDYRSIRRLMTDRPHTFTVRSSDDRRLAAALIADPAVFGAELLDGRLSVSTSDYAAFTQVAAADRGVGSYHPPRGRPDERFARERLQLPGPPVNAFGPLVMVTLRGLLGRRRLLLMVLLVALPVAIGLLVRLSGGRPDASLLLDTLVIRTVLPLVALVLGTAALGSEIDDGTVVHLLVKPIARRWIVLAGAVVAAGLTAVLVVPSVVLTGLLTSGIVASSVTVTFAFAVAALIGGTAYSFAFLALSTVTSRALVIGLAYTLIWEGVVAGLLEGTRFLSIRQATLGVAAALGGTRPGPEPLEPTISVVILGVVIVGSLLLATRQLARFEVRGGD